MSLFDDEHSGGEDRWIILGSPPSGPLLVVVHNFDDLERNHFRVRLISARRATARERRQYEEQP